MSRWKSARLTWKWLWNSKGGKKDCRIVGNIVDRWSPYDKYYPPSRRVGNERSYLTALRVICIFQPEASGRSLLSAIWNARGWRPRFDLHFSIETVPSPLPLTLRWLTWHEQSDESKQCLLDFHDVDVSIIFRNFNWKKKRGDHHPLWYKLKLDFFLKDNEKKREKFICNHELIEFNLKFRFEKLGVYFFLFI